MMRVIAVTTLALALTGCIGTTAPRAVDARLDADSLWLRLDNGMRCQIPRSPGSGTASGVAQDCAGVRWQVVETPGLFSGPVKEIEQSVGARNIITPSGKITVTATDGAVTRFEYPDRSRMWDHDAFGLNKK